MSWYYAINGGEYESKDTQSLKRFLDNVAAHLTESGESSYVIHSLELHFVNGDTDGYELATVDAQSYLNAQMADYESEPNLMYYVSKPELQFALANIGNNQPFNQARA